jgi:hypothetical protein
MRKVNCALDEICPLRRLILIILWETLPGNHPVGLVASTKIEPEHTDPTPGAAIASISASQPRTHQPSARPLGFPYLEVFPPVPHGQHKSLGLFIRQRLACPILYRQGGHVKCMVLVWHSPFTAS